MSQAPQVSIIMNCYNSSKYLREAIDSVYAQTFKDWEIIFWDNASTDESPQIAKSYDSKIKYFRGQENVSLGKARNWAIERASGEYIAFLDCDDKWLPEKLQKQIDIFNNEPETAFIYTNYYLFDEETKSMNVFYKKERPRGNIFEQALLSYPVGILTVMVRKNALDKLEPLFDEKLSLAEEYDVFMRVLYNSYAEYIHKPLAIYRTHAEMSTIKHSDKFSDERLYVLGKLRNMNDSVEKKYKSALTYIEARIHYNKSLDELEKVVRLLKGNRVVDPAILVLYFLSKAHLFTNKMFKKINNGIQGVAYFNTRKSK